MARYEDLTVGKLTVERAAQFESSVQIDGALRHALGIGTSGNTYWVDSGNSVQQTGSFDLPYDDLDAAIGQCTANNGDLVIIKEGHSESLTADSAVDIDVAGVTVVGLGHGADRPTFTFTTDVAADFKLAAASVRVINLLFKSGIDALTGPIEISADDCALVNCEYQEVGAFETTDVVVTASTPLRMLIDGFVYREPGGVGGTQNQSVIQLNGADEAVIRNCHLVADSGTGVIEDATVSDDILIENCLVENTEISPTVGILLQATTNGTMRHVHVRVASGTTYLTAANDMQFFDCWGVGTDADRANRIGAAGPDSIEGILAGGDGIGTWPAAAVPGNGVSMAEVLRDIWDALRNGTGGAEPTTNKSVNDYLQSTDGFYAPGLGFQVVKTGAVLTADDDLFTVTGKCLITLVHGDMVTAETAATTSLTVKLNTKTAGVDLCAATAVIGDAAGTLYMMTGDQDDALNGGDAPTASHAQIGDGNGLAPVIVDGDTIESTVAIGGGTPDGTLTWTLYYIPLESGASVAAAA